MVENNRIASDDIKVAYNFNDYFSNPVEYGNFANSNFLLRKLCAKARFTWCQVPENLVQRSCQNEDRIFKVILKYQNHPSLTVIK